MSGPHGRGFVSWVLRIMLLVTLVALGSAAGAGLYQEQTLAFTSSAQVLIEPRDYSQLVLGQSFAGTDPARQLTTARVAAQSLSFEALVAEAVGGTTTAAVHKQLTVTVVEGANVLQLTATGNSGQRARTLASAAATALTTFYEKTVLDGLGAAATTANRDLSQKIALAQNYEKANPSVKVLSKASDPVSTTRSLKTSVTLGALAGLVVALLLLGWNLRTRTVTQIAPVNGNEEAPPRRGSEPHPARHASQDPSWTDGVLVQDRSHQSESERLDDA